MTSQESATPAAELTVVVPTFNERDNVGPLVERLKQTLASVAWDAIFVDNDSTDGTSDVFRAIAQLEQCGYDVRGKTPNKIRQILKGHRHIRVGHQHRKADANGQQFV